MHIIKMITKKRCYIGQNKPAYVVIHETDNWSKGADAKAHATAMKNGNLAGTVHYYVDSKNIYQTLEHQDGAYAVGDGNGAYGITNRNSINIEICVNPETDYYVAVDKTEQLAAHLLKQYGWGTDRLKRHYDASRKHCPRRILDEGLWSSFVKKTAEYMVGAPVSVTEPVTEKAYLCKGDSGSDVKTLQENLISLGYSCGPAGADGDFGDKTDAAVRLFQKANGLTVDGLAGEKTQAKIKELLEKKKNLSNVPKRKAKVTKDNLDARVWGGKGYDRLKSRPTLKKGEIVEVCDYIKDETGKKWFYIRIDGKVYGFAEAKYIAKVN